MGSFQKEELLSGFVPNQFCDFFVELTKLLQTVTVQDYNTQFEKLFAKFGQLPQSRQVSCFVSGLRDLICADFQAGRLTTLTATIRLACVYEARNSSQRRVGWSSPEMTNLNDKTNSNS